MQILTRIDLYKRTKNARKTHETHENTLKALFKEDNTMKYYVMTIEQYTGAVAEEAAEVDA